MNFLQFKTEEELMEKTGLTPEQALKIIDHEISELKKEG